MDAPLDTLRTALLAAADLRYGADAIRRALAKAAVETYCAAYAAYQKAVGTTITNYTLNGRSVTRAGANATAWREAWRRLREFFPDLPEDRASAAELVQVDFSATLPAFPLG